ncbi:hypothetical protein J4438_01245 [Candidatus Woesearchaeota archaeon]|nr:hypothetical protein [Candidatus Woesearchaeota archaeon]
MKLPKNIKNLQYFAKGKRSIVYIGVYNNKKVAIKTKNPKSEAKGRLENEAKYLRLLNKHKIGPKLIKSNKDYIIYSFVEGDLFIDYIKKKKEFVILKNILEQCRILDKLKINKLEFTHPIKHIFIKNKEVTIIDFERCYKSSNPKNVTQFCQFLMSSEIFNFKNEEFKRILIQYKQNQNNKNFNIILKFISSS